MKKKIKLTILIVIMLMFLIFLYMILRPDSLRFKNDYEMYNIVSNANRDKIKVSIPINNKAKYISNNDVLNLFKDGTGVIYFGYSTCPWCRNVVPLLLDVVENSKVDNLYYYNIHSSKFDKEFKNDLFKYIESYLRKDTNNEYVIAVPDVYFIKNGKIIGRHLSTLKSQKSPYDGLTSSQKKELKKIYKDYIKVLEG